VRYFGWLQADPLVSLLVSALILGSAFRLLRRSAHILLEGVPDGLETAIVAETVRRESGVEDVHHVHVWQLAGGRRMATLHARIGASMPTEAALAGMQRVLRDHFHIFHATIQIEDRACDDDDCHDARHGPQPAHAHHQHDHH
jgi:cobalt-zinc-cadmium efflux system protein